MATTNHDNHGHHHMTAGGAHASHVLSQAMIFKVFGALLVLMVVTIAAAFMIHANTFVMQSIALVIAFAKAGLVVFYFMGLKMSPRLIRIFAIGGFVWFLLLFSTIIDYATRPFEPVEGWEPEAASALPRMEDENASVPNR